jgi:hypothetical protein
MILLCIYIYSNSSLNIFILLRSQLFESFLNNNCLPYTLFADDSSVIVKGKTAKDENDKTVEANNAVVNCAENYFWRLNAAKTNILQGHIRIKLEILLNQMYKFMIKLLITCNEDKLLGVFLTDTMKLEQTM